jgi:hypothetical protein
MPNTHHEDVTLFSFELHLFAMFFYDILGELPADAEDLSLLY